MKAEHYVTLGAGHADSFEHVVYDNFLVGASCVITVARNVDNPEPHIGITDEDLAYGIRELEKARQDDRYQGTVKLPFYLSQLLETNAETVNRAWDRLRKSSSELVKIVRDVKA